MAAKRDPRRLQSRHTHLGRFPKPFALNMRPRKPTGVSFSDSTIDPRCARMRICSAFEIALYLGRPVKLEMSGAYNHLKASVFAAKTTLGAHQVAQELIGRLFPVFFLLVHVLLGRVHSIDPRFVDGRTSEIRKSGEQQLDNTKFLLFEALLAPTPKFVDCDFPEAILDGYGAPYFCLRVSHFFAPWARPMRQARPSRLLYDFVSLFAASESYGACIAREKARRVCCGTTGPFFFCLPLPRLTARRLLDSIDPTPTAGCGPLPPFPGCGLLSASYIFHYFIPSCEDRAP